MRASELAQQAGDKLTEAWLLSELSFLLLRQSRFAEALEALDDAKAIFTTFNTLDGLAQVHQHRGTAFAMQGEFEGSIAEFELALDIRQELDDKVGIAQLFNNIGAVTAQLGDFPTSQAYNEQALSIQRQLKDYLRIALLLNNLAELNMFQGDLKYAQDYAEEAVEMLQEIGDIHGLALSNHTLADILQEQGKYSEVAPLYHESMTIYNKLGEKRLLAEAFESAGKMAALQKRPQDALRLIAVAQNLRETINAPMPPVSKDKLDRVIDSLQQQLPQGESDNLIREGRETTLDEALQLAFRQESTSD